VAAHLVEADGLLYELSERLELLLGERRAGAAAIRRRLVVHEHADRQSLDRADGLASVTHRLVELEVAGRRARHALRLRRRFGSCGIRGSVGASRAARLRRDLRRLVAQRAGHALHAFAAMRVLARLLRDREVELRRNARADALGADDRPEQALDATRVLLLELLTVFELRAREARGVVRR